MTTDLQRDEIVRMTEATYLAMERVASEKHEHWNGETFRLPSEGFVHAQLVGNLVRMLGDLVIEGPCVVAPGVRVHMPSVRGYVYPDVVVVCGRPEFVDADSVTISNPRVIVEVLSASTECFDRGEKFAGYRSLASLVDYLLVAQTRVWVEHYTRDTTGAWALRELGQGEWLSLTSIGGRLAVSGTYSKVTL